MIFIVSTFVNRDNAYAASFNNDFHKIETLHVSDKTVLESNYKTTNQEKVNTSDTELKKSNSEENLERTPNTADAAKIFLFSIITIMSLAVVAAIIIKKVRT